MKATILMARKNIDVFCALFQVTTDHGTWYGIEGTQTVNYTETPLRIGIHVNNIIVRETFTLKEPLTSGWQLIEALRENQYVH